MVVDERCCYHRPGERRLPGDRMKVILKRSATRCVVGALLMFAPSCLFAQKAEADIKARLVKKPLFLRGQWGSDKLAFDAAGHVQGASGLTSFTLAGVEIG